MERIGIRIQKLRVILGLTAKEVSQSIGVAESTYRAWESGRAIQGEPYVALSKILRISVYELLTGVPPDREAIMTPLHLIEAQLCKLKTALHRLY